MFCPACKKHEMFAVEFEAVELDYCYRCGGVWLDSGELELIGERAGALRGRFLEALENKPPARARTGRRCPVCGRRLEQVEADTKPPTRVERCPAGHGLWFDRGELGAVVRAAGAAEDSALARLLCALGAEHAGANQQPEGG